MLVSLLNTPLREAFDIEPLVLNLSYTSATMLAALPLVWVGKATDRWGPRRMMMIVATAFGAACLFTASIAHVSMVVVAFFLLRLLGQGSLALVGNHAIAMWFHARLGTIAGLRQVALFSLWVPLPKLTLTLIERYGWRFTWAIYGVVIAVTIVLLSWRFVRDRPEDLGLELDGNNGDDAPLLEPGHSLPAAMRTSAYWILVAAGLLPPMIGTAIMFDIQPLLGELGLPGEAAAGAVSTWSAGMAIMAIPGGRLVDNLAPRWLIAVGTIALGISCLLWLGVASASGSMVAMAICAVGQSLIGSSVSASTARFFGRKHHGEIRSSLTRLSILATGLGPLVFGLSVQLSGTYRTALLAFAGLCVPVSAAALWLSPPSRI
jgi:MFS family permease